MTPILTSPPSRASIWHHYRRSTFIANYTLKQPILNVARHIAEIQARYGPKECSISEGNAVRLGRPQTSRVRRPACSWASDRLFPPFALPPAYILQEPTSIFTQCVSDDSNHPSTTLATIFTSSERQMALPGPVSLRKAALILNDHKWLKREAPLTSSRRLPVSCSESSWHHTLFTLLRSPLAHRTRHHPLTLPGDSRTDSAIKILKNSAARSLPLNAISRSSNSPQNPFSTVPRTSRLLQTTNDTSPLRRPLKNSSAHKK
ncbi:hypothetical protein C8F01DRAFT_1252632 [Mycena amicta]|nr:hypothetical protein C8F01DRAFT_1252632 [Mycena amicta]